MYLGSAYKVLPLGYRLTCPTPSALKTFESNYPQMTDQDEDIICNPVLNPSDPDPDPDEETPDFRFLSLSLPRPSSPSITSTPTLPRRGSKDFEHDGTASQMSVLESSRSAMHNALSHPRFHTLKGHLIGIYHPQTGLTTVLQPKRQYFRTMGRANSRGEMMLLPEEALYLVERGSLDLRWGGEEEGAIKEGESWPLSVQAAYALLLGGGWGLTLDRFTVYTGLKRCGYIVQRAPTWDSGEKQEICTPIASVRSGHGAGVFTWLYRLVMESLRSKQPPRGPLVRPGLYRSYSSCSIHGLVKHGVANLFFPFAKPKR